MQKAITKQAALGWTVQDSAKSAIRTQRGQQLLLQAQDGRGWVSFLTRVLRDYLLTDNGAFVEVVRASNAAGSRVLGIQHLDTMRCYRTGDPGYPVVYEDLRGRVHVMRDYQVLTFVDMESPRADQRGTGLCAASCAYLKIYQSSLLEQYLSEKMSGTQPKEIHLVNGVTDMQVGSALRTADEQRKQQGYVRYKGVVMVPALGMDNPISGYRIPISEVPDGFNPKEQRSNAYLAYALALGLAVQDIEPLSGQGLGTGTQTVVLDDAAEGYGLAGFRKQAEHLLNECVLPSSTTFGWSGNDVRDQQARADVSKVRASVVTELVTAQIITPIQGLQLLADAGDVPDAFLPDDSTPEDQLTDSEKPQEETPEGEALPALPVPAPVLAAPTTKARRVTDVAALLDDPAVLEAARQLAQEVRGE